MSDKLEVSVLRLKVNDALRAETPEEFLKLTKLYKLSSVPDALFMAASVANFAVFKEVVNEYEKLNRDINTQDDKGNTVLHLAALQNRLDIAEFLLQRPTINDTIVNNEGLTACDVATTEKMQELMTRCQAKFIKDTAVKLLTAFNNQDLDTITDTFQNPRVSEVIDINGLNPDTGMTVLHASAASDNEKLVELILEHGGNPLIKDSQGRLASDLTKSKNIRRLLNNAAKSQAILVESIQGQDPHGPPKMRGYLHKWTNFTSGYKLRYFVLENNKLSYMKNPDDVIRGSINMRNARVKVHSGEHRKFEIKTPQNKVHLRANNPVEANQWVWSLQTSITSAKDLEKLRRSASRASRHSEASIHSERNLNTSKVSLAQGASIDPKEQTTHSLRHPSPPTASAAAQARSEAQIKPDNASDQGGRTSGDFSDAGFDNDLETFEHSESDGESLEDEWDEKSAPSIESIKAQMKDIRSVIEVLIPQHQDEQTLAALKASIDNIDGLLVDLNLFEKFHFQQVQGLRGLLERSENAQRIWAKQVQSLELKNNQLEEKVFTLTSKDNDQDSDDSDVFYDTVDDWKGDAESETTAAGETDQPSDAQGADSAASAASTAAAPGAAESEPKAAAESSTSHLSQQQQEIENRILSEESFNGYEDPPRAKLDLAADNRPKLSLWSTLKNLIGKDMTKMTLPVTFNECCSLLQRSAEDMEYVDLLDKAASAIDDPGLRMAYIAAFAASSYSSTINRIAKPFNPLLGETYEYCRPDENFRLMSEQVSHHPPIGALHAQSPKWDFYGQSNVDSCFNGRSFVINPLGLWYLNLRPDAGADVAEELYSFRKVTSSVVGILIGNPVVDNHGLMNIENHTTGIKCALDFKARGWRASSAYHVSGTVTDKTGKELYTISGAWNDKIFATKVGQQRRLLLWQVHNRTPAPFNLTNFAITLNALPDNLRGWLFPTDTRLRPDQRAMEEGRYDEAADLKHAVEQKQRKARQEREAAGEQWEPRWFTLETHPVTGREYYKPTGAYWISRKEHDASRCPDIFV